jgi:hypothetical protein
MVKDPPSLLARQLGSGLETSRVVRGSLVEKALAEVLLSPETAAG